MSETSRQLVDTRGRPLADLRISVTDRCNFRCRYCMPRESFDGQTFLEREELLSFEEVRRVAGCLVGLGVRKLRLTGGEPLLRRGLSTLVAALAELEVDLALTTNGVLLGRQALALRAAGLSRLTVSLDALDEATFQRMCDAPSIRVADVLTGLTAAIQAGFPPPKINCVVRRGVNDHQIVPLARHFLGTGHVLRFIEYMDVGEQNGWTSEDVLWGNQVLDRLSEVGPVRGLPKASPSEVAQRYSIAGELEVGLITSISQPFCGACSRLRLSADGGLYTCLFSGQRHDLKVRLRRGASDTELADYVAEVWSARADRYSELRQEGGTHSSPQRHLPLAPRVEMSFIGG